MEYLHVDDSSVVIDSVVDVVPVVSVPVGVPFESVGGVVSDGGSVSSLSEVEVQPGSFG